MSLEEIKSSRYVAVHHTCPAYLPQSNKADEPKIWRIISVRKWDKALESWNTSKRLGEILLNKALWHLLLSALTRKKKRPTADPYLHHLAGLTHVLIYFSRRHPTEDKYLNMRKNLKAALLFLTVFVFFQTIQLKKSNAEPFWNVIYTNGLKWLHIKKTMGRRTCLCKFFQVIWTLTDIKYQLFLSIISCFNVALTHSCMVDKCLTLLWQLFRAVHACSYIAPPTVLSSSLHLSPQPSSRPTKRPSTAAPPDKPGRNIPLQITRISLQNVS